LRLGRQANGVTSVTTDAGLSLSEEWLGGAVRQVEVRALDGQWMDVSERCGANTIPTELVLEWSRRNERTSVEFRLSL
ncbi:MAG: hypothetical protein ACRDH2_21070, partial [Anaerolineales bacterium]